MVLCPLQLKLLIRIQVHSVKKVARHKFWGHGSCHCKLLNGCTNAFSAEKNHQLSSEGWNSLMAFSNVCMPTVSINNEIGTTGRLSLPNFYKRIIPKNLLLYDKL